MKGKYIILIIVATALITGLLTSLFFTKYTNKSISIDQKNDQSQAELGAARLFGEITAINTKNGKREATIQLAEFVVGQDNQEQAAIEEDTCTLEQVEQDTCINNPFFLRKTNKTLSLPFSEDAKIIVYARDARDGMKTDNDGNIFFETITLTKLADTYGSVFPATTAYHITTKNGVIIEIKEQYIP